MSQKQMFDNATQSEQLKPVLAAALSSLEVQLDQELIRYRRTRPVSKAVVPGRVGNSMPNSTQNFAAIAKVVTPWTTTVPTTEIKTTQEIPSLQPQEAEDLFSAGVIKAEELQKVLNSESSTISESETEISPHVPSVNVPDVNVADAEASSTNGSSTNDSSSLVKAFQTAKNREAKAETENIATEPSDYLESSEALLRSLAEEEPQTKKRSKSNNNSLLSPLGIGSMLLVLVACSALGFALVSPKNIPLFGFGRSSSGNSEQKAQENQTNTEARNTSSNTSAQVQPTPIAKYPNLANEQFPEVNSANDVVGLKPKEKPAPIPTTVPPTLQNPVAQNPPVTVPALPMQPIPQTAPAPVPVVPPLTAPGTPNAATTIPAIAPTPTPEAPIPTTTPPKLEAGIQRSGAWYRLSVPNQGPEALAAAKKAVSDAYVSDDGKVIYLGSFKTEQEAKKQLKELEAQGIKAKAN
ncbi:MAG: hypothetical protein KME64_09175 [Scytonematopsis contorta HA4267-MV1]|jgi:hypothetical protein|nr:hypothetical protein [Scytonematopsis contorta HA4267-MV1]